MMHAIAFAATFAACLAVAVADTRVLFIGNSFTFVNDLPHQLKNVAHSLGKNVSVANSTIGGCTLYAQQPQYDQRTKDLLQQDWDFIVLQDYSALPTVQKARAEYLGLAVDTFVQNKKRGKVVMYLTWGYHNGNTASCPSSDNTECFPKGSLASLTSPPCSTSSHWHDTVDSFPCMGYALVRGYLDMFRHGVDMVAPCGVSWQVVRGVQAIPTSCKHDIDQQYNYSLPTDLPYPTTGELKDLMLYRTLPGGVIDKHPNVAGQYLNALTFYATLFGESPEGAAAPLPTAKDPPLTPQQLSGLQKAACDVVLKHKDVWGVQ
eukprot:Sspe_Gene.101216::Locus_75813_Transcript_1_1_Confidence_1.000_Length_1081::g.101216::m.101216